MRPTRSIHLLSLSLSLSLATFPLPASAADDPSSITQAYSYARHMAQDVRRSWRHYMNPFSVGLGGLSGRSTSGHDRRRSTLSPRSGSGMEKCQLRLVEPFSSGSGESSSPATSSATSSSSSGSTSSVRSTAAGTGSTAHAASSSTKTTPSSTKSSTTSTSGATFPTSSLKLVQSHNGSSFFDGWDFFTNSDPTQGSVNYLDAGDAWNSGLVSINSAGHAIMGVDTTQVITGNRNSVRINFANTFNGGLLTADFYHMPAVCGAWPAWWTTGPNWPTYGEIDILEGVHLNVQNQVSLHTAAGCVIDPSADGSFSGTIANGNSCGSTAGANTGCGILSGDTASMGQPFNNAGGGVYAMLWDTTGIRVWLFHRGTVPADLGRDAPLPDTWGTPMAFIPASECNPYQYMQNHVAVIDTTLCGTWAGSQGSWDGSCAASTGFATCVEYVQNMGSAFSNAYWEIASVKLYQ